MSQVEINEAHPIYNEDKLDHFHSKRTTDIAKSDLTVPVNRAEFKVAQRKHNVSRNLLAAPVAGEGPARTEDDRLLVRRHQTTSPTLKLL